MKRDQPLIFICREVALWFVVHPFHIYISRCFSVRGIPKVGLNMQIESGGKFPIVKLKRGFMEGNIKFMELSLLLFPLPALSSQLLLVFGHQRVTSWLLVWLLSLVLPTVPRSVLCSLFAMLSKFHTSRPAGNTLRWTTKTCFTSTSTQIMQLSAGPSWIWSFTTTGRQWLWCMKTAQVWDAHQTAPGHVWSKQREPECPIGINSPGGVHGNAFIWSWWSTLT